MNEQEILKSLMDTLGLSQEEAASLIKSKAVEEKKPEDEEYSEDKEKELEKAMNDAKEAYGSYCSKKPIKKEPETKIEKSENVEEKSLQFTPDMLKSMLEGIGANFTSKLSDIEKSLGSIDSLKEEINHIKEEVSKIGNYTPPAKSNGLTKETIIEKAMDGGIQQDGKTYMSVKVNKDQIGDILSDMVIEEKNETIAKSLETDLSNLIGGFGGNISPNTKRLLAERKNIVIV